MITRPSPARKPWLIAIASLALAFGVLVHARVMQERRPIAPEPRQPTAPVDAYQPQRMSLEGTLVCLPHAPGYPPTKECAMGLRTADGTHYAVDFALMSSIPEEHRVGDRIAANGVMVPIERLSTDHWRKYAIVGIFSITDGFKVLE